MRLIASRSPLALGLVLSILTAAACVSDRCGPLTIYRADEARACVYAPVIAPELEVCTPTPASNDPEVICLANDSGELAWAVIAVDARVSGTGWRHTRGTGSQALTAAEQQRCGAFEAAAGGPPTSKRCPSP